MKTKIFVILLALFAFCSVSVFCQLSHTVTFSLNDLSFEKKDGYDVVNMKGLSANGEIGSPLLPGKGVNLIIPSNMDVASITVTQKEVHQIGGKFNILPKQSRPSPDQKSTVFTQPDPKIYGSDLPYPVEIVKFSGAGYFDGSNRIAAINIIPFQYNPISGELTMITSVSFTLNFKDSKVKPIYVKRRLKSIQEEIYDKSLNVLVDNPEDIKTYGYRPKELVEKSVIDTLKSQTPLLKSISPKGVQNQSHPDNITTDPIVSYLIITNDALVSYFNNFVNYKATQGITVYVTTAANAYQFCPNGDPISGINDNPGSIRQFINCFYLDCGTSYVLLGGDQTVVPVRYGWCDAVYDDTHHWEFVPADLYYSDFNGNWNVDFDAHYGELYEDSPDFYPEVFVGRIPFTNGQDVLNWTSKVIQYEQNPFNGDRAAVTKVLWSGADAVREWPDKVYSSFPGYFTHVTMKEQPWNWLTPDSPHGNWVINTLNQGYGFYNIYTHGAPTNIAVATCGDNNHLLGLKWGVFSYNVYDEGQGGDPYYYQEDHNGFDYMTTSSTIIYSTACDNANFDATTPVGRDCMAKAYLRLPGAGGPAFIGNTRSGLYPDNASLHIKFIREIFDTNAHIGVAYALSKPFFYWDEHRGSDGHYTIYSQNLFGDPSMLVWTSMPPAAKMAGKDLKTKDDLSKEINQSQPKCFNLYQNYPNPFNPSTTISFDLPEAVRVDLLIYDILGREVASLVNEDKPAGHYSVNWNAQKMTSGIYFCKIIAGNFVQIREMMLMK